ncbi:pentapeptide repeat-containing protein [Naasia sp. SYSU D00948]|uniref:pentapeptide repeat-containing protein n=1 Tax=Naasia sp. SYSU D00948 TaxID=2817379 RepID=UPI001B30DD6D|nr:pentapeptide repeat-containing protein [Naasia sp. SYSU D00948]
MVRRARGGESPRIDPLRLPELEEADPAEVVAGAYRETERLAGADLSGRPLQRLVVDSCEWDDVTVADADLTDARFAESLLRRVSAPVLRAAGTEWRDVVLEHSRIGSAELREAEWRSVRLTGCKLGYVGLRGARLTDVLIEDCVIDELDLGGADATRIAVAGTTVTTLDVTAARLRSVDLRGLELSALRGIESLRGVRVTTEQLAQLAPLLAAEHGIDVD